jgi:hypothetical protein
VGSKSFGPLDSYFCGGPPFAKSLKDLISFRALGVKARARVVTHSPFFIRIA